MPNPVKIECPKDEWTKIATGVTKGFVWLLNIEPQYLHTYRVTSDPAPIDTDEAVVLSNPGLPINSSVSIDIYVYPQGKDGEVRVDV